MNQETYSFLKREIDMGRAEETRWLHYLKENGKTIVDGLSFPVDAAVFLYRKEYVSISIDSDGLVVEIAQAGSSELGLRRTTP